MSWIPKPHQEEKFREALLIIEEYNIVYLSMEERTGKSITSMMIAEALDDVSNILIVTKTKALKGWEDTLTNFKHSKNYTLGTYTSIHKVTGEYDLIILDEAHSYISGYPKTSLTHMKVKAKAYNAKIIYASATPNAQGPQLLFNQFSVSKYSPWKAYKDFYLWFKHYAIRDSAGQLPTTKISSTQNVVDYTKVQAAKIYSEIDHLFVTCTRQEAGHTYEPEDVIHYIQLTQKIKDIYNYLIDNKAMEFTHEATGRDYKLILDTPTKLRFALHMLEGGTIIAEDEYIDLGNREKVDYILEQWGDNSNVAIMYQYKADKIKLDKYFKEALVLQASTYAEGVDLSHIKHLVVYSQDTSTAKYSQRRARQANINRTEEINVHFLLVKRACSEQIYKTVAKNKKNFIDRMYIKEKI